MSFRTSFSHFSSSSFFLVFLVISALCLSTRVSGLISIREAQRSGTPSAVGPLSTGDVLVVALTSPTDRGGQSPSTALSKAVVDSLVVMNFTQSATLDYIGEWLDDARLRVVFTDVSTNGVDVATVSMTSTVMDPTQTNSVSQSPALLSGSFDSSPPVPALQSIEGHPGKDGANGYGPGDRIVVTLTEPAAHTVDVSTSNSNATDPLLYLGGATPVGQSLGNFTLTWKSYREIQFEFTSTPNISDGSTVLQFGNGTVLESLTPGTFSSPLSATRVLSSPTPPTLTSCVARNGEETEGGPEPGDTITFTFDLPTNGQDLGQVSTTLIVNCTSNCGSASMSSALAMHAFIDDRTMELSFEGVPDFNIGAVFTVNFGGAYVRNEDETSDAIASSCTLEGSFSPATTPTVTSFAAVNGALKQRINVGDYFEITFSEATNMGGAGIGQMLDQTWVGNFWSFHGGAVGNKQSTLGTLHTPSVTNFSAQWQDASTLRIFFVGVSLDAVMEIGAAGLFSIKAEAGLYNAAGTSSQVMGALPALTGGFGAISQSVHAELESVDFTMTEVTVGHSSTAVQIILSVRLETAAGHDWNDTTAVMPAFGQCRFDGTGCDRFSWVMVEGYTGSTLISHQIGFRTSAGAVLTGATPTANGDILINMAAHLHIHMATPETVLSFTKVAMLTAFTSSTTTNVITNTPSLVVKRAHEAPEPDTQPPSIAAVLSGPKPAFVRKSPSDPALQLFTLNITVSDQGMGLDLNNIMPSSTSAEVSGLITKWAWQAVPLHEFSPLASSVTITNVTFFSGDSWSASILVEFNIQEYFSDTVNDAGMHFITQAISIRDSVGLVSELSVSDLLQGAFNSNPSALAVAYGHVDPTNSTDSSQPSILYTKMHVPAVSVLDDKPIELKVDITALQQTVALELVVADPESGIDAIQVLMGGSAMEWFFRAADVTHGDSKLGRFYSNITLPVGSLPTDDYTIDTVRVNNTVGIVFTSTGAASSTWDPVAPAFDAPPFELHVRNQLPTVTTVAFTTNSSLDVSSTSKTVNLFVQLHAGQALPFASESLVYTYYGPAGGSSNGAQRYSAVLRASDIVSGNRTHPDSNGAYTVGLSVPVSIPHQAHDGDWVVSEILFGNPTKVDGDNQGRFLRTGELGNIYATTGSNGRVSVTSSPSDVFVPTLANFSVLVNGESELNNAQELWANVDLMTLYADALDCVNVDNAQEFACGDGSVLGPIIYHGVSGSTVGWTMSPVSGTKHKATSHAPNYPAFVGKVVTFMSATLTDPRGNTGSRTMSYNSYVPLETEIAERDDLCPDSCGSEGTCRKLKWSSADLETDPPVTQVFYGNQDALFGTGYRCECRSSITLPASPCCGPHGVECNEQTFTLSDSKPPSLKSIEFEATSLDLSDVGEAFFAPVNLRIGLADDPDNSGGAEYPRGPSIGQCYGGSRGCDPGMELRLYGRGHDVFIEKRYQLSEAEGSLVFDHFDESTQLVYVNATINIIKSTPDLTFKVGFFVGFDRASNPTYYHESMEHDFVSGGGVLNELEVFGSEEPDVEAPELILDDPDLYPITSSVPDVMSGSNDITAQLNMSVRELGGGQISDIEISFVLFNDASDGTGTPWVVSQQSVAFNSSDDVETYSFDVTFPLTGLSSAGKMAVAWRINEIRLVDDTGNSRQYDFVSLATRLGGGEARWTWMRWTLDGRVPDSAYPDAPEIVYLEFGLDETELRNHATNEFNDRPERFEDRHSVVVDKFSKVSGNTTVKIFAVVFEPYSGAASLELVLTGNDNTTDEISLTESLGGNLIPVVFDVPIDHDSFPPVQTYLLDNTDARISLYGNTGSSSSYTSASNWNSILPFKNGDTLQGARIVLRAGPGFYNFEWTPPSVNVTDESKTLQLSVDVVITEGTLPSEGGDDFAELDIGPFSRFWLNDYEEQPSGRYPISLSGDNLVGSLAADNKSGTYATTVVVQRNSVDGDWVVISGDFQLDGIHLEDQDKVGMPFNDLDHSFSVVSLNPDNTPPVIANLSLSLRRQNLTLEPADGEIVHVLRGADTLVLEFDAFDPCSNENGSIPCSDIYVGHMRIELDSAYRNEELEARTAVENGFHSGWTPINGSNARHYSIPIRFGYGNDSEEHRRDYHSEGEYKFVTLLLEDDTGNMLFLTDIDLPVINVSTPATEPDSSQCSCNSTDGLCVIDSFGEAICACNGDSVCCNSNADSLPECADDGDDGDGGPPEDECSSLYNDDATALLETCATEFDPEQPFPRLNQSRYREICNSTCLSSGVVAISAWLYCLDENQIGGIIHDFVGKVDANLEYSCVFNEIDPRNADESDPGNRTYCRGLTDQYFVDNLDALNSTEAENFNISCPFMDEIDCCVGSWYESATAPLSDEPDWLPAMILRSHAVCKGESEPSDPGALTFCKSALSEFDLCDDQYAGLLDDALACAPEYNATSWSLTTTQDYKNFCTRPCLKDTVRPLGHAYRTCLENAVGVEGYFDEERYGSLIAVLQQDDYTCLTDAGVSPDFYCRRETDEYAASVLPGLQEGEFISCSFLSSIGCCAREWREAADAGLYPETLADLIDSSVNNCSEVHYCTPTVDPFAECDRDIETEVMNCVPEFNASSWPLLDYAGYAELCGRECRTSLTLNLDSYVTCLWDVSAASQVALDASRYAFLFRAHAENQYTCKQNDAEDVPSYCRQRTEDFVRNDLPQFNETDRIGCDFMSELGCCAVEWDIIVSTTAVPASSTLRAIVQPSAIDCGVLNGTGEPQIARCAQVPAPRFSPECYAEFSAYTASQVCLSLPVFSSSKFDEDDLDGLCTSACFAHVHNNASAWLSCEQSVSGAVHDGDARADVRFLEYTCSRSPERGYCRRDAVTGSFFNFANEASAPLGAVSLRHAHLHCDALEQAGCCYNAFFDMASALGVSGEIDSSCTYLSSSPCSSTEPDIVRASSACITDFSAFKTAASNCLPEDFLRVPRNESALDSLCKDACYASLYGAAETWLACEMQQTPALTTYAKSAVAMFKYACSANSENGNYCLNELHQVINFPPSQHDLVLDLQLNSSTSCASFTGAGCCAAELREFVSTTPINDAYLQTVESCGLPTEPCSSGGFGYSSGCQTDFESFDSIVECLPEDLLNRTRSGSELATLCGSVCYADAFSAASRWLQCENNATEGVLTPVTGFVQYLTFLCEQNSTGAYCAATDVLGTMATYPDAGASDSDPVTDFKLNSSADCGLFEPTGCCAGTFISYALETPDGSAAAGLYTSCGLSFTPCTTSSGGGGSSGGTSGGDEVLTASSACQSYLDSYHGMESCFSTDFLYSSYDDTTLAAFCASSCFFSIETLAQDWLSCEHTNPSGVSADVEAVVQYLSFLCSSDSSGNWCASDSVAGTFIGFDQVKNPRLADVYIPDCTSFNDTGCCGTEWVDLVLATDSHSSVSLMQQQCAAEGIPVLSGDGCDGATSGGGGSGSSDEEYSLECASVAGQFNSATDCFGTVLSVPLNQSYLTDFCASSCYSNLVSIVQGWLACEESNQNGILGPVEGYEAYLNYLCSQNEQDQFCARQSLTGKLNMYGEGGPLYGLELDAQTLTCSNVNSTGCCASHWDDYVSSTDQSSALDLFISDCTTQGVDLELNAPCDGGSGGGEPRSSPACASFVDLFSDQVDIFGENVLETADSAVFETGCNAPTYLYLMGNLTLWEECELAQGSSGLPYYAHGYYKLMYYMCSRNNNGDWCFDRSETGNFTIFDAQSEPLTTAQIEPTVSCLDYTKTGCCFQEWMTMVSATGASSAAIANTADCSFLPTDHCPVHYGGDGGDDDGLAPSAGCVAVANTFRNVSDCLPSDVWSVTSSSSLEQHCGGTCYTESLQAAQNWLGCEQDNLEGRVKSPNTFISALTLLCSRDDTGDFCMPKVATLATIKSGDDFPGVTLGQQSCSELHSAGCCVHPWSDFIGLTAADTQMQAWLGTCDAEVAPDAACGTQREWSYSCTSLYESAKLALNCLPQNRSELLDTSALSQLCDGSCYTGAFEAVKEWASCEAGLGSASDASVSSLTGFLELICSKDTDGEYCLSSTLVGNMVVFPDGAADRPDDNVGVDVSGLTDCASVEAPGCCMADLLEYGAAMFKGALTEHVTQLTCSNVPSTVCADVFVRQPWPEDRAFGSRYGQCSSNAAFAFDAMSRFCGMDSFPDGPRAWFELDETTLRDVCLPGCVAAFGDELDNWIDCLTDPVRSASIEDLRLTDSAAYNASADMYMARRMRSQLLFQCTGDVDDPSPDGGYCMSNLALDIFDSERPDPFADILSCFEASTSNSRDKRAACPTLSDSFSCSTFGNAAFFCCVGSFAQRVVGEDRALEVSRVLPEAGTSLFSTYINSLIRARCSSVVPATYDITKFTDDACPTPSTGGSSSACVSDFYDLLSAAHTCLGSDVLAAVSTGADVSEVARLDDLQLTEICKCGEAVYDRATEVQQCVSNNPGALEQFDLSGTPYNGDGEPAALEEIKGAIGTVCRVQPSSSDEPDAFCVDLLYNVNVSVSDEGSLSLAPEDEACVAYNAMGCCRASFLDWTNEVSGVTALLNEMQSNCDVGGTVGECAELFEPRQACRASLATVASTASSCGLHGLFAGNSVSLSNLNASGLAEACAESNRACLASLSVAADNAATCVRQYVGLSDDLTDEVEETLVLLAESASSPDLFCGAEVIGDVTNVEDRGFCALKLAALVESTTSTGGTTGAGTQGTSTSVDPVATLCSAIQAMGCCAVNYAASNASDETTEDLKLFCARYNLPNLDQPSCGVVGKPVVLRVPQVSVLRLVTNPPSIIVQFDALTNQQFAVLDSAGVDAIVKAAAGESIGSRYSGRWTTPAVLQIFVGDPTPTEGTTLITEGSKLTIKATANIRDQTGESDAVSGETPAAVGELALPVVEEPIPDPPQVKSAVWNTDFRTFIIYFDSSTNGLDSFQPFVSCESVLDSTTVSLVSTRADCIWAAPAQLFVRLPSSVSIPLSSTVGVRSGVILATGGESDPATVNLTTTLSLPAGVDTSVSRASVVCPSSVSACGNIVCTASALGSLGSSFSYNWTLASASPALSLEDETALETYLSTMTSLNVQRISVPATLIEAGTTYVLQMRVTNVAGSSQTVTSTVVVAAQSLPEIRLSGEQRVTWPVTRTNRAGTVVRFEVCGQTITTSQSFNLLSVSWQQLTTLTAEQSTATGLVTADISPDLISLPSSVLQSSTLLVPPFTPLFVPGRTYVFEATVSARLPDADAGDAPLTNSVLLVVDTPEVPLQPIVRPSGTVRVSLAFAGSSFELDGSFSYDPALARGDQVALTYQWSCERAGVVCSLPGVDLTQSTLSVPVATLEPTTASTLYEFALTVSSSTRSSTSRVTQLAVDLASAPLVTILASPSSLSSGRPLAVNQRLILQGLASSAGVFLRPGVASTTFAWSVSSNNLDLTASGVALTSVNSPVLVIRRNQLAAGTTYTFKLTVATPTADAAGVGEISITTAGVPSGGVCRAVLGYTEAGEAITHEDATAEVLQQIDLECEGWQSDTSTLPLSYQFRQVDEEDGALQRLSVLAARNSISVRLGTNDLESTTNVTISVLIANTAGGLAEYQFAVGVSPPQLDNETDVTDYALEQLGQFESEIDATGNPETVYNAAHSICDLIDASRNGKHLKRRKALGLPIDADSLRQHGLLSLSLKSDGEPTDEALEELRRVRQRVFEILQSFDERAGSLWTLETVLDQLSIVLKIVTQPDELSREFRVNLTRFALTKLTQSAEELPRTDTDEVVELDATVDQDPLSYVQGVLDAVDAAVRSVLDELADVSDDERAEAEAEAQELSDLYDEFVYTVSRFIGLRQPVGDSSATAASRAGTFFLLVQRNYGDELGGAEVEDADGTTVLTVPAGFNPLELNGEDASGEVFFTVTSATYDPFAWATNPTDSSDDDVLQPGEEGEVTPFALESNVVSVEFTRPVETGDGGQNLTVSDLTQELQIVIEHAALPPVEADGTEVRPVCVFWDETAERWSTEGCRVSSYTETHTTCLCNHLTQFKSEASQFTPTVQSVSSEDFLALSWSNLMEHPTTLISITVACLLFCLLFPFAHRVDLKARIKYAEIRRRNKERREDKGGGILPPAASHRGMRDPQDESESEMDSDNSGVQLQQNGSSVEDMSQMQSRRDSVGSVVSDAPRALPSQAGQRSYDASIEMSSMSQVDLRVLQAAENGNGDGMHGSSSKPVSVNFAGRTDSGDEGEAGEAGEPGASAARQMSVSASGESVMLANEVLPSGASAPNATKKRGRGKTLLQGGWRDNLLVYRMVTSFRHRHLWLSVAFRHPRDPVNSKQRLACLLGLVLGNLAVNAAFYGSAHLFADITVALISSIAVLPTTVFLMFLFRGGTCTSARVPKQYLGTRYRHPSALCPRRGKMLGWLFWFVWCSGCMLMALVYGLQFDLNEDERESDDQGFLNTGVDSLTGRWLVSCGIGMAFDFCLSRPAIITLRTVTAHSCPNRCGSLL